MNYCQWSVAQWLAAFGPEDLGSNPGWFAVSKSNKKLSVINNASTVTLVNGDK